MGLGLESPSHILLILVVVLLVFGAKRLPEMGQSLGAGLRGFKDALTGQQTTASVETLDAAPPDLQPPSSTVDEPAHVQRST